MTAAFESGKAAPRRSCDGAGGGERPSPPGRKKYRLGIVAMHPTQYHAPLYRALANSTAIDVDVMFLDNAGLTPTSDRSMGTTIQWDVPLLDGYRNEFLTNWSLNPQGKVVLSRINPSVFTRIRQSRWDAVLVTGYQPISCWLSLLAARQAGSRILFRGESCLRQNEPSDWKSGVKRAILRTVFSVSDAVLYSCSGNRRFFEHYGCPADKLAPIPCAVDNDFFRRGRSQYQDRQAEIRASLGIGSDTPIVLNIGRMAGIKRQQDLLAAVASLQQQGIQVATVFVGDGPQAHELRALVEHKSIDDVHFVGFVNQSKVACYYSIADVFAICSEFDPSPKVVNEALNFELPIVSSDRPGQIGDVIVHRENALVYRCGHIDALADSLVQLVNDPVKRAEMGRQSLKFADDYSLAADVRCVENVLERLSSPPAAVSESASEHPRAA